MIKNMALPSRAITLIRAYSKPLTHPDWRTLHKTTNYNLYNIITNVTMKNINLVMIIQTNMKNSIWYELFCFVRVFGLEKTCVCHTISKEELLKMDGIREAIIINKNSKTRMKNPYGFIG